MKRRVWHWSQLKPPLLPIRDWLPSYERRWLRPDLIAAAAVWAVLVPEGMAYASLAGMPPRDRPLRRPGAAARLRRPRHLPAADGRAELGGRCVLGGRRRAARARRRRPLHRAVGAARAPRRRAPAGRRPRPRRLRRRLLRPPGADRLRRRPRPGHRRRASCPSCWAWRAAAPASSASSRCWCASSDDANLPTLAVGARGAGHHLRAAGLRAQGAGDADRRRARHRSPSPCSACRTTASRSSATIPDGLPSPRLPELRPRATSPTCCPTPSALALIASPSRSPGRARSRPSTTTRWTPTRSSSRSASPTSAPACCRASPSTPASRGPPWPTRRASSRSSPTSSSSCFLVVTMLLLMPLFHDLPEAVLGAIVIAAVAHLVDVGALRRLRRVDHDRLPARGAVLRRRAGVRPPHRPGRRRGRLAARAGVSAPTGRAAPSWAGPPGRSTTRRLRYRGVEDHPDVRDLPRSRDPARRRRALLRQRALVPRDGALAGARADAAGARGARPRRRRASPRHHRGDDAQGADRRS